MNGYDGTTVYATLQDAHIEYNADSSPTLTTSGNVELHPERQQYGHAQQYQTSWPSTLATTVGQTTPPGRLTIKGSGSLTAEAPSSGIRIQNGTLDGQTAP